VLGFGVAAVVIGVVGLALFRPMGRVTARQFEKSSWVGLRRTPEEWARANVVIALIWLIGGAVLVLVGVFGASR
jgi:hypothetical protein